MGLWRDKNKERAQKRAWYIKNSDRLKKKAKDRHEILKSNPDEFRRVRRQYAKSSKIKNPRAYTSRHLKHKYGITIDDYDNMLTLQGGVCALCSKTQQRRLCVDHCHKTGRVRGLLCTRCNVAIAALGDNENGLKRALEYIMGNATTAS